MKKTLQLIILFVLTSSLYAQNVENQSTGVPGTELVKGSPISWNFASFDIYAPGNGYMYSWFPTMASNSFKLILNAGYGQLFTDDSSFSESLLYRGGLTLVTNKISFGADFSKNFTRLPYAFYGQQTGLNGNMRYTSNSGVSIDEDVFYGDFDNRGLAASNVFHNEISVSQNHLCGIDSEFSWKTEISLFKESPDTDYLWGINSIFDLSLFNNMISSRLSLGSVERGSNELEATMYYDFSSYAFGLPQNLVVGNSCVVLENKLRFFPLADIVHIPFISDMLYVGGVLNGGVFLGWNELVKDAHFSYFVGPSFGILFFKLDMGVTYSYSPDYGWIFNFLMKQIDF